LQDVEVPYSALSDLSQDRIHLLSIDKFYSDIVSCISTAATDVIPCRSRLLNDFNIPGWNTYVQEKHDAAREAYLTWLEFGRPQFG
jgi:hypothetical protein